MPSVILSATDLKISNIFSARSFESSARVLFDTASKSPFKVRTLSWNGPLATQSRNPVLTRTNNGSFEPLFVKLRHCNSLTRFVNDRSDV